MHASNKLILYFCPQKEQKCGHEKLAIYHFVSNHDGTCGMCFRGCRRCRPFRLRIHRGNSHERPPRRAGAGTDHHRLRCHRRQPLKATCRVSQGCDTVRWLGQHALSPSDLPRFAGTQGDTHRHPHPRTDLYPAGKYRKSRRATTPPSSVTPPRLHALPTPPAATTSWARWRATLLMPRH